MKYAESEMHLTPATKKLVKYVEPPPPGPNATFKNYALIPSIPRLTLFRKP